MFFGINVSYVLKRSFNEASFLNLKLSFKLIERFIYFGTTINSNKFNKIYMEDFKKIPRDPQIN